MSHQEKHAGKHAQKKAERLARNKRHQRINEQESFHEDNRRLQREFEEGVSETLTRSGTNAGGEEVVWSAKLEEVRNRLTGKKRASRERWNRFAGTASGGGRGL